MEGDLQPKVPYFYAVVISYYEKVRFSCILFAYYTLVSEK